MPTVKLLVPRWFSAAEGRNVFTEYGGTTADACARVVRALSLWGCTCA